MTYENKASCVSSPIKIRHPVPVKMRHPMHFGIIANYSRVWFPFTIPVSIPIYMYIHMYIYIYVCTYITTNYRDHSRVRFPFTIPVSIPIYIYIHMYIYIYVCTYITTNLGTIHDSAFHCNDHFESQNEKICSSFLGRAVTGACATWCGSFIRVSFRKRATHYRALLRKVTNKDTYLVYVWHDITFLTFHVTHINLWLV